MWTCPHCRIDNHASNTACVGCDQPHAFIVDDGNDDGDDDNDNVNDDDDMAEFWVCGVCAEQPINAHTATSCQACRTPKQAATAAFARLQEVVASRTAATATNILKASKVQRVLGGGTGAPAGAAVVPLAQWACGACTMFNPGANDVCLMCGGAGPAQPCAHCGAKPRFWDARMSTYSAWCSLSCRSLAQAPRQQSAPPSLAAPGGGGGGGGNAQSISARAAAPPPPPPPPPPSSSSSSSSVSGTPPSAAEVDARAAAASHAAAALCASLVPRLCTTAACMLACSTKSECVAAARTVATHLVALYEPIESAYIAKHGGRAASSSSPSSSAASVTAASASMSECSICSCEFDDDVNVRVRMRMCGHETMCSQCLDHMVRVACESGDVLPWLKCPADKCGAPIAAVNVLGAADGSNTIETFAQSASASTLRQVGALVCTHARKLLLREEHFAPCTADTASLCWSSNAANGGQRFSLSRSAGSACVGGVALTKVECDAFNAFIKADRAARATQASLRVAEQRAQQHGRQHVVRRGAAAAAAAAQASAPLQPPAPLQRTCAVCCTEQLVSKVPPPLDPEFQKMQDEGCLKPCPKCGELNVKEFGVCNVINCGKCGVWWNFITLCTGRSSDELKALARSDGTLWNPGELEFQTQLQHTNLPAFIALLERNGQSYNPHYRRGGH